jgi:hypothetical protein
MQIPHEALGTRIRHSGSRLSQTFQQPLTRLSHLGLVHGQKQASQQLQLADHGFEVLSSDHFPLKM